MLFVTSILHSVHPPIPPSVHRSPASLTTLTVHTKGVHNSTKIRKSVVVIVMTIVIDLIIDYSQLRYI